MTILVTDNMLKIAQITTELGAHATSNLAGAYDIITELYQKMAEADPVRNAYIEFYEASRAQLDLLSSIKTDTKQHLERINQMQTRFEMAAASLSALINQGSLAFHQGLSETYIGGAGNSGQSKCAALLRAQGFPAPRTCRRCGLGPCTQVHKKKD